MDEFRKHCLVNGLDDIGLTLQKQDLISKFEGHRREKYPWLDSSSRNSIAEVKVSASKSASFYAKIAAGFLTGLEATEERPAREAAEQVRMSATGAAIERATSAACELERSGQAKISQISTDFVEVESGGRKSRVPQLLINLDAPVKARRIVPVATKKVAEGCGCSGKASEW